MDKLVINQTAAIVKYQPMADKSIRLILDLNEVNEEIVSTIHQLWTKEGEVRVIVAPEEVLKEISV